LSADPAPSGKWHIRDMHARQRGRIRCHFRLRVRYRGGEDTGASACQPECQTDNAQTDCPRGDDLFCRQHAILRIITHTSTQAASGPDGTHPDQASQQDLGNPRSSFFVISVASLAALPKLLRQSHRRRRVDIQTAVNAKAAIGATSSLQRVSAKVASPSDLPTFIHHILSLRRAASASRRLLFCPHPGARRRGSSGDPFSFLVCNKIAIRRDAIATRRTETALSGWWGGRGERWTEGE
jgi:hypothetical protein